MSYADSVKTALVDIPLRGFNLTQYMSLRSPMQWDFAKVKEAVENLERDVKAAKAATQEVKPWQDPT